MNTGIVLMKCTIYNKVVSLIFMHRMSLFSNRKQVEEKEKVTKAQETPQCIFDGLNT
jgi:hypothetical protein